MRFLLKAEMPVETGNECAKSGALTQKIQAILEECRPEAAYFVASGGTRTAFLFLNMDDPSQLPKVAEPWFLAFNASIEITPAMNVQDLAKAGKDIEKAVKKYG